MPHGAATLHRAAHPRYPFRRYRLNLVEISGDSRNIGTGTTINDSEGATELHRSSPSLGYHTHENWLRIGKVGVIVTDPAFPSIRDFHGRVFFLALTLALAALFALFLSIFVKMGLILGLL